MLFSSITFLYVFLPIVLVIYYLAGNKIKNFILLIASIWFYAWGQGGYVLLLLGMVLLGYVAAILIEKYQNTKLVRFILTGFLLLILSFLGYFKYYNFFLQNVNQIFSCNLSKKEIVLPIGISFYTFQLISYVVDVYKQSVPAQRNILTLGAYVSFFPQLIAGPIVRYEEQKEELEQRKHTLTLASQGATRFILGLSKKVLIANSMGELCNLYKQTTQASLLYAWLYAIAFSLQIYYDFSGYSDMAIGLGKIFGFVLPENFNYPYMSKSVTEFWRRWHISLGSWFRDYVYIPLGGNRKGKIRQMINIFIVWALTGLWHGCAWNFVWWGVFYALLLLIEKIGLLKALDGHVIISHCYLLLTVVVGFVIFDSNSISQMGLVLGQMFGVSKGSVVNFETLYYLKSFGPLLFIAVLGATSYPKKMIEKLPQNIKATTKPILLTLLLIVVTAYLVDGSFNPFLYFRF